MVHHRVGEGRWIEDEIQCKISRIENIRSKMIRLNVCGFCQITNHLSLFIALHWDICIWKNSVFVWFYHIFRAFVTIALKVKHICSSTMVKNEYSTIFAQFSLMNTEYSTRRWYYSVPLLIRTHTACSPDLNQKSLHYLSDSFIMNECIRLVKILNEMQPNERMQVKEFPFNKWMNKWQWCWGEMFNLFLSKTLFLFRKEFST